MQSMLDAELVGNLLEESVDPNQQIFSKYEWLAVPEVNGSNSGDGNTNNFTFDLTQHASGWLLPSRAYIKAQVVVKKADGSAAPTNIGQKVFYNLKQPQSWISRATLKINQGPVEDRVLPAYVDYAETALTSSQDWLETTGRLYGYAYDTANTYITTTEPPKRAGYPTDTDNYTDVADVGPWSRSKAFFKGTSGTLILPLSRLFSTIASMQMPITMLPFQIDLLAEYENCLNLALNAANATGLDAEFTATTLPKLYINKLELMIPKVSFTPEFALKATKFIESNPEKTLNMVIPKTFNNYTSVENTVTEWNQIITPSSINPTALYLMFFPDGTDYTAKNARFTEFLTNKVDINTLNVLINDQYLMARAISSAATRADYSELYTHFLSFGNATDLTGGVALSYRDYRDHHRIVALDLTNVPAGALEKGVSANVRIEARITVSARVRPIAVLLEEKQLIIRWQAGGAIILN